MSFSRRLIYTIRVMKRELRRATNEKQPASHKRWIFVTGFFGAPIREAAETLAAKTNLPLIFLDREIEAADGRSIRRLVMTMGEHEYRNQEYRQLRRLLEGTANRGDRGAFSGDGAPGTSGESGADRGDGAVVCCGDGILLDEDTCRLMAGHRIVIVGLDLTADQLWARAKDISDSCHAFMSLEDADKKRAAFLALHQRQTALFQRFV